VTRPRTCDRGSAAIWVLACSAVVLAVAAVVVVRTLAVLARHRAESAADLAALAAAGQIGVGADPCGAARAVASADHASVQLCTVSLDPSGRSGTVRVRVTVAVDLPLIGPGRSEARARAGRLPGRAPVVGSTP
jgi:secretion/DNA translocation related TadE-like protein